MVDKRLLNLPNVDIQKYIPDDDSVLLSRIKHNDNWARFYIYCCKKVDAYDFELNYIGVWEELNVSDRSAAWQLCECIKKWGYADKRRVKGRTLYYLKQHIYKPRFWEAALDKLGVKKEEIK